MEASRASGGEVGCLRAQKVMADLNSGLFSAWCLSAVTHHPAISFNFPWLMQHTSISQPRDLKWVENEKRTQRCIPKWQLQRVTHSEDCWPEERVCLVGRGLVETLSMSFATFRWDQKNSPYHHIRVKFYKGQPQRCKDISFPGLTQTSVSPTVVSFPCWPCLIQILREELNTQVNNWMTLKMTWVVLLSLH